MALYSERERSRRGVRSPLLEEEKQESSYLSILRGLREKSSSRVRSLFLEGDKHQQSLLSILRREAAAAGLALHPEREKQQQS